MTAESFNKTIKSNHVEVQGLLKGSRKRLWQLQKELQLEAARERRLQKLLRENDEGEQSWVVNVPDCLLPARKVTGKKINWKKLVLEYMEQNDTPVTSDLLYHKFVLYFDFVPLDRIYVVRNISAALHYLEARDEKLFRQKDGGKKGFIYGLKHHFTLDLSVKPYYLRKLRVEEGDKIVSMEKEEMRKVV